MPHCFLGCVAAVAALSAYPEEIWNDGAVNSVFDIDVNAAGGLFYGATGATGLVVWTTANVGVNGAVGRLDTLGMASRVVVVGDVAFLVDSVMGVAIVDVSAPAKPVLLGSYEDLDVKEIAVSADGTFLYALRSNSVITVDVSSPASPALLATKPLTSPTALCASPTTPTLYVSDATAEILLLNMSSPSSPTPLGTISSSGNTITTMTASGNTVYLGAKGSLILVDVTNPAVPVKTAGLPLSVDVMGISAAGTTIYMVVSLSSTEETFLKVVDVSTPAKPVEVGSTPVGLREASAVGIIGTTAYVACKDRGVKVVSVADKANMTEVGEYPGGYFGTFDVAVSANRAFLARYRGLFTYDITNPATAVQVASDTSIYAYKASVDGNTLAVADMTDLVVYDVSGGVPVLLGKMPFSTDGVSVKLMGSTAYAADDDGLKIYDLKAMKMVGSLAVASVAAVDVANTTAYLACGSSGTVVVDVSDSTNPTKVGELSSTQGVSHRTVAVQGTYAYIGAGASLLVVDVSNMSLPMPLSTTPLTGVLCTGITISGTTAYVSSFGSGVAVYDITSPASPRHTGTCQSSGVPRGTRVVDSTLYVADVGLWIFNLTVPATQAPQVATAAPVATAEPLVPQTLAPNDTLAPGGTVTPGVNITTLVPSTLVPGASLAPTGAPGGTPGPVAVGTKSGKSMHDTLVVLAMVVSVIVAVAGGVGVYCYARPRAQKTFNNPQDVEYEMFESPDGNDGHQAS